MKHLFLLQLKKDNIALVELLLSNADLDINMKNNDDQTIIQIAAMKNKEKIFELLLTRKDLDINLKQDDTLLIQLIEKKKIFNLFNYY